MDEAEEIASELIDEGYGEMYSMCGNAGQETLVGRVEGAYYDYGDDIINGAKPDYSGYMVYVGEASGHPYAISQILDAGFDYMRQAAQVIRAGQIADIFI